MKISTINRTTAATAALLIAVAGALTGCATDTAATAAAADSLTITDAWVKTADSGMSAGFGILENTGTTDILIESASTPASGVVELHETVMGDDGAMVMQAKEGGFTIPAGARLELAPGGNHIMLMGLAAPIVVGDDVTFTLTLSDGSVFTFTAPAKDFTGANENYVGDGDMDMDMNMDSDN
ncbi:MAG: copper chaperone PCu(A)C [Microbacteriaceae bacterium]